MKDIKLMGESKRTIDIPLKSSIVAQKNELNSFRYYADAEEDNDGEDEGKGNLGQRKMFNEADAINRRCGDKGNFSRN